MYAFSNRVSKYVRQKLIKLQGEIDKSTITAGDFKALYQKWTDTAGKKSNKDIVQFNNTINQFNTMDISRLLYPTTEEKEQTESKISRSLRVIKS